MVKSYQEPDCFIRNFLSVLSSARKKQSKPKRFMMMSVTKDRKYTDDLLLIRRLYC